MRTSKGKFFLQILHNISTIRMSYANKAVFVVFWAEELSSHSEYPHTASYYFTALYVQKYFVCKKLVEFNGEQSTA